MDRKGFGAILDETVSKMEHDVRVLKNQQATLKVNVQELSIKRDKLSGEIAELEQKHTSIVKEYKEKIDKMMKSAQEKLDRANSKEAEAAGKLSGLNEKTKDCEKLIKSNEGSRKNLESQNSNLESKIKKLNELADTIVDSLKNF